MGIMDKIADLFGRKERVLERQMETGGGWPPQQGAEQVKEGVVGAPAAKEEPVVAQAEVKPVTRRKKGRRCGVCGRPGHNSRTCPKKG